MNYLTYEEYTSLGGVCDVTAFNRGIDRACSAIDNATFNRIQAMAEVPQRAKVCCRDLVEYYHTRNSKAYRKVKRGSRKANVKTYRKISKEVINNAMGITEKR